METPEAFLSLCFDYWSDCRIQGTQVFTLVIILVTDAQLLFCLQLKNIYLFVCLFIAGTGLYKAVTGNGANKFTM